MGSYFYTIDMLNIRYTELATTKTSHLTLSKFFHPIRENESMRNIPETKSAKIYPHKN